MHLIRVLKWVFVRSKIIRWRYISRQVLKIVSLMCRAGIKVAYIIEITLTTLVGKVQWCTIGMLSKTQYM